MRTAPATPRRAGNPQAPTPARHPVHGPTATAHRTRDARPERSARPATPRSWPRQQRPCANACECPPQARSWPSSSSTSTETDGWRTRLAEGAATHLSSHARHPRPATSDKTKGSHAQPGRQPQRESARRPVGTLTSASDITDARDLNSKPHCGSARSAALIPRGHRPVGLAVQLRDARRSLVLRRLRGARSSDSARLHRDRDDDEHDHAVVPYGAVVEDVDDQQRERRRDRRPIHPGVPDPIWTPHSMPVDALAHRATIPPPPVAVKGRSLWSWTSNSRKGPAERAHQERSGPIWNGHDV